MELLTFGWLAVPPAADLDPGLTRSTLGGVAVARQHRTRGVRGHCSCSLHPKQQVEKAGWTDVVQQY